MAEEAKTAKERKNSKRDFIFSKGRRREAVARVRLYSDATSTIPWGENVKKGDILVNSKPAEAYFPGDVAKAKYTEPFKVTNTLGKFITTIRVEGGGLQGQLNAAVHGISRALDTIDSESYHGILKKRGFLTRDARERQRRKVGMGGKSRRAKQSPKR